MPKKKVTPKISPTPGFIRIRGTGAPLCPGDLRFEVLQRNGRWIPLRGVCKWEMTVTPDEVVTAAVMLELGEVDLAMFGKQLEVETATPPPP